MDHTQTHHPSWWSLCLLRHKTERATPVLPRSQMHRWVLSTDFIAWKLPVCGLQPYTVKKDGGILHTKLWACINVKRGQNFNLGTGVSTQRKTWASLWNQKHAVWSYLGRQQYVLKALLFLPRQGEVDHEQWLAEVWLAQRNPNRRMPRNWHPTDAG